MSEAEERNNEFELKNNDNGEEESLSTSVKQNAKEVTNWGFEKYPEFIFGLFIGVFLTVMIYKFVLLKSWKKSFQYVIEVQKNNLEDLEELVYERIKDAQVDKAHKGIWARLKKFFKNNRK